MKKFEIPVSFRLNKSYLIEAENLNDALIKAKKLSCLMDGIWIAGKSDEEKIIVGVETDKWNHLENLLKIYEEGISEIENDEFIERLIDIDEEKFSEVEKFLNK